jgi:hypothetical protein
LRLDGPEWGRGGRRPRARLGTYGRGERHQAKGRGALRATPHGEVGSLDALAATAIIQWTKTLQVQ